MSNFNEIFRRNVPYDNINSHKKPRLHLFLVKGIFGKTGGGGNCSPSAFSFLGLTIPNIFQFNKTQYHQQNSFQHRGLPERCKNERSSF